MLSKHRVVFHVNNVHHVLHVIFLQILQNFQLNTSLVVVLLFVFNNFDGYLLFFLVIKSFDRYSETALTQKSNNFISVGNVVLYSNPVVSLAVIEAEVRILFIAAPPGLRTHCLDFFGVHIRLNFFHSLSKVIDVRVIQNLSSFVLGKMT